MPELAEVEYYRKQWDAGLGGKILRTALHAEKRLFRGVVDIAGLEPALRGAKLRDSEARAKLICFRLSRASGGKEMVWLGIHLGMTGRLGVERADFVPGKHDHLVLFQKSRALVFNDARVFGRVHFHQGAEPPPWWAGLPPAITSGGFTPLVVRAFLARRARLAVKAALLVQNRFPGIGNWMADEILWRARIAPQTLSGRLSAQRTERLWRETREVCRVSLETVGKDFSDPPANWLFHERWSRLGKCPACARPLRTAKIGGRTTRWCARCQK